MDDISNRTLAIMLLAAIVVSLGATVYTLNYFNAAGGFTGRAAADKYGNVTLYVESAESFKLNVDTIDFGAGWVNTSQTTVDTITKCTNATLTAGSSYSDTGGGNCWVSFTDISAYVPTSFVLENDGNVNLSLYVQGPNSTTFFTKSGVAPPAKANLSWIARNVEGSSCSSQLENSKYWDFQLGGPKKICNKFSFVDNADTMALDVRVIIPSTGLAGGRYENASITFTGAQN